MSIPQQFLRSGATPSSIAIADVNADDIADLITADSGADTVSILSGLEEGGFEMARELQLPVGATPRFVTVRGLDRDTIPDLITANEGTDTLSVFWGLGDGDFDLAPDLVLPSNSELPSNSDLPSNAAPSSVAVGDLDNDGILDLATANTGTNNVSILQGLGNRGFTPPASFPVGQMPLSVVAATVQDKK